MGATESTLPDVYDYVTEKTTYNGSIYTGYSSVPQMVENYPWLIWGKDSILSDAYIGRMAAEISCWGLLALMFEIIVNLGGLSNLHNAEYPNAPGNEIGLFSVDVTYFTVVAAG